MEPMNPLGSGVQGYPLGFPGFMDPLGKGKRPRGTMNPLGSGFSGAGFWGNSAPGFWARGRGRAERQLVPKRRPREQFFIFLKQRIPNDPAGSETPVDTKSKIRCTLLPTMEQGNPDFVGTAVASELPSWLSVPDPKPPRLPVESRELLHAQYHQIFERIIEGVYRGRSLQSLVEDDPRMISYEDFLRWIKRDPMRYERFKEAQEMRTEFLAGEILEIADGVDAIDPASSDTVNRDKLRIDSRKWLMSAHNRKRYGEVKQVEVAGSISITEALQQAQQRVIEAEVVDVTPRLENHDE